MNVYQHFREDEKPFIDDVLQWIEDAEERYIPKLTDFLDPRQQDIASLVTGRNSNVRIRFCGGSEHAERKRLLFCPPFYESQSGDFQLTLFNVDYPHKFSTISHPELLGSLMGLGLKREKFGDLLFQDQTIQFVAAEEIAHFVQLNLTKVGKTPITLVETPISEIVYSKEKWDEQTGTVSSMRLDAVLAEIYNLSRAKITPLIESGRVKVNWKTVEQPSFSVNEGDYLSARGFGRSKLISVDGKTKKKKWRVAYGKRI